MSAMSTKGALQAELLGSILERLSATVAQVSGLHQSLADIEVALTAIRRQCEEIQYHAAAATVRAHGDGSEDETTIAHDLHAAGVCPGPCPLQHPERDRDTILVEEEKNQMQKGWKDSSRSSNHGGMVVKKSDTKNHTIRSLSSLLGVSLSLRVLVRLGSLASRVMKTSVEILHSVFSITPAQARVQGIVALDPARKHKKRTSIPSHIPAPRPPTHPSPFPKEVDVSSYPPELKQEGPGWFVLFNPSPQVKRVLNINLVHTLEDKSLVNCAKFSWDGKWLATGCRKTAQIYDIETGTKTHILDHKSDKYIWSVAFSPDGKYLVTGGEDKQIWVWNIANQHIYDIFTGHLDTIWSVQFSPNGYYIISGSRDGTVRIWDVRDRTFKVLTNTIDDGFYLPFHHKVRSVAISPDGKYVAVGSVDWVVTIWEITSGVLLQTLRGHTDRVYSVTFTPDGKGLISGSWDMTLKYWDVSGLGIKSGASTDLMNTLSPSSSPCLMNLYGHKDYVYSTAVSHDGTWVACGSFDRNVVFWDTRTGVAQCQLSGHTRPVYGVDLSPKGNHLATASEDGQVRIWSYI